MTNAIGIRLDKNFLEKIDKLSHEEVSDRSDVLRKLIQEGYKSIIKKKAAQKYIRGNVTISEAARLAEMTIWEMEQFLIEEGHKSSYSIDDLKNELKIL